MVEATPLAYSTHPPSVAGVVTIRVSCRGAFCICTEGQDAVEVNPPPTTFPEAVVDVGVVDE